MSAGFNLFATPVPAEFVLLTTRDLARLAHQAEDTADDILLLQADAEIQRRQRALPGTDAVYREHYMDLWRQRRPASPTE